MHRISFSLFISLLFLVGCQNNSNVKLEEEVIKLLQQNNEQLNEEAILMYHDLEYKTRSLDTEAKAFYYLREVNAADSCFKNLIPAINEILEKKNNELTLKKLLNTYKNNLFKLDIKFKEYVDNNFYYFKFDSANSKEILRKFEIENYSSNNTLNNELAKNKATLMRNYFFKWCIRNATPGCDLAYYSFQAIAGQNSTKFNINDELVINAGIGAFNKNIKSTIIIDKDTLDTNNEGVAEYKIKVGNKRGKFSKKVSISYVRPNGEKQNIEKEIIYTVE